MNDGAHVLVIGGTRFMGYELVWQLIFAGYEVSVLNRGNHPDPFGDRVERLRVDRTTPDFRRALEHRRFDAAVDFAVYNAEDARGAVAALGEGRVGHYIVISTGAVYTVLQDCPIPSREGDYAGPLMPTPDDPAEERVWQYGVEKREVEDVLREAWERDQFPCTPLRLPIVDGERDYSRRLESYLWRILDGRPVLLPDGGVQRMRHVYSGAVTRAVVAMLGRDVSFGQAYNLTQDEIPTLASTVAMLAEAMGSPVEILPVSTEEIHAAGLRPTDISPFSSQWNSCLDPCRAKLDLDFQHEPMPVYLERIVACFLAHIPAEPPPSYQHRAAELTLARFQG